MSSFLSRAVTLFCIINFGWQEHLEAWLLSSGKIFLHFFHTFIIFLSICRSFLSISAWWVNLLFAREIPLWILLFITFISISISLSPKATTITAPPRWTTTTTSRVAAASITATTTASFTINTRIFWFPQVGVGFPPLGWCWFYVVDRFDDLFKGKTRLFWSTPPDASWFSFFDCFRCFLCLLVLQCREVRHNDGPNISLFPFSSMPTS